MTAAVPPWLQVMRDITGTLETPGSADNPVILGWANAIATAYPEMAAYCAGYKHDAISWCGLTIAYCMTKAGIRPVFGATDTSRFLWALAWKAGGEVIPPGQERPGDIVIFVWDNGGHHVALLESVEGKTYVCRGGNQTDQVKVSNFAARNCVGIRRPKVVAPIPVPGPTPTPSPSGGNLDLDPALQALALVARLVDPNLTPERAAEIRAKIMFGRDVANIAIALLDKLAPVGSPPVAPITLDGPAFPNWLKPQPTTPAATPSLPADGYIAISPRLTGITMTDFAGKSDPQNSAYTGKPIDGSRPGFSYPAKLPAGRRLIRVFYQGRSAIADAQDLGPWNLHDDYAAQNARPMAEGQFRNRARAENGRIPSNPAGLDGTPGLHDALGVPGPADMRTAVVDFEFVQPAGATDVSTSDDNATFFTPQVTTVLGLLARHGLTALGGYFVTMGWMQSGMMEGFVGGGMVLAAAAWSWWQKQGQAQALELLKKLTRQRSAGSAIAMAQALPHDSAVSRDLP